MTLKTRAELETHFKNGRVPSQEDFADLIESMLNQRDDQILGQWRAGTLYRVGDIVFHKRAIWEVTDGDENSEGICAREEPGLDNKVWRSFIVPEEHSEDLHQQQASIAILQTQLGELEKRIADLEDQIRLLNKPNP